MADSTILSRVRSLPSRILVGMIVIIFVAGSIIGFGLGVKVEHGRVKAKKPAAAAKAKTKKKAKKGTKTANSAAITGTLIGGQVRKVTKRGISVAAAGGVRKIFFTKNTRTYGLGPAVASLFKPGSRVMYRAKAGTTVAEEVVLLAPQQGLLGSLITSVGSNTLVVSTYGRSVKLDIGGAKLRRAVPGSRKYLRRKSRVYVVYRAATVKVKVKKHKTRKRKVLVAYQLIQLPAGSVLL